MKGGKKLDFEALPDSNEASSDSDDEELHFARRCSVFIVYGVIPLSLRQQK